MSPRCQALAAGAWPEISDQVVACLGGVHEVRGPNPPRPWTARSPRSAWARRLAEQCGFGGAEVLSRQRRMLGRLSRGHPSASTR